MAKLENNIAFDAVLTGSETPPINLETIAGTSPVALTQHTRFIHVTASVDWSLSTPWVPNVGHGILNAVFKVNQYYPTPYFMILNEGSIINTNTATALGSDTSTEAHNVIFLWQGGSVTNAAGALLEQRSADDGVGAVHFEKGPTSPNELYNDGTIKSGLVAVYNKGQFRLENTGTIEGNVYSSDGTNPIGQTSYLINSAAAKIQGKHEDGASPIVKQAAVFMQDTHVNIQNDGIIEASGRYGIYTSNNSRIDLTNTGTIEAKFVGGASAASFGVFVSEGGTVNNSGTIQGELGLAFGRVSNPFNKDMTLTNSGTIKGTAFNAIEALILDTISITNTATGEIVSDGSGTSSGVVLRGATSRTQTTTIENSGLIEGAIGIRQLHLGTAENLTIENSGTISARTSTGTAIYSELGTTVTLDMQTGGQLTGGIDTRGATDDLKFSGNSSINGTVAGMETISILANVDAAITGDLTDFVTAAVATGGEFAVNGALNGDTITLTGGRLELGGATASLITTFSADASSELHFDTLTTTGAISAASISIDGVKLTIGSASDAELTLINNTGLAQVTGTFEGLAEGASLSIGSSTYAISYVGGDGNDIVLTRTSTGGSSGGGTTPPPTSSVVDGVTIGTSTITNSDGSTSTQIAIPIVTGSRQDSEGDAAFADIPLATVGGSGVLTAQLPVGFGLTATGSATPKAAGSSLADLIREIKAHTPDGSEDQTALTGGGTTFLANLAGNTPLIVQTIVPVISGNTPPGQPLIIKGLPQVEGGPLIALVIDGSKLPPGTIIELQDVHFAAVIGPVSVQGGAGSQMVWGDSAGQSIILGEDDDVLHGGGGDDIIGSAGGNDLIFGNAGNDTMFGGAGADQLHGGTGTDIVTYDGAAARYKVTQDHAVITVESLDDPTDIDTLINVESIHFADQVLEIGYADTLDMIAGLYRQLFDRQGDLGGVQYWAKELANGGSAGDIVMKFFDSAESRQQDFANFGPEGEITLELLYEVLFDRRSDDGGLVFWQTALANGMSLTEIANHFAFSPEMQQNHAIAPTGWEFLV